MYKAVAGIYKKGKIELIEPLNIPERSKVIITILPEQYQEDATSKFLEDLKATGLISEIP
ncbi:MAG TPA: DUF104 domain-containing protein, partial [Methanosarcinales archaeon]|nr:DUF104 domain-containing protein [Methanosarcinales archaeon]